MDQVEGGAKEPTVDIPEHEARIAQTSLRKNSLPHFDQTRLTFEPDRLAGRPNAIGQQVQNPERSTADIDNLPTWLHSGCGRGAIWPLVPVHGLAQAIAAPRR